MGWLLKVICYLAKVRQFSFILSVEKNKSTFIYSVPFSVVFRPLLPSAGLLQYYNLTFCNDTNFP